MVSFEFADDLQHLVATITAKGMVVHAPSLLRVAEDEAVFRAIQNAVRDCYQDVCHEMQENLGRINSKLEGQQYLTTLRGMFSDDMLSLVLSETAKTRAELAAEVGPVIVSMAAFLRVKRICAAAAMSWPSFTGGEKQKLGQYYLIATSADNYISELLRKIDRQLSFAAAPSITVAPEGAKPALPPAETTGPQNSKSTDPRDSSVMLEDFLIELKTTTCDVLAESVGLRPPADTREKTTLKYLSGIQGATAKIIAIADVLSEKGLIQSKRKTAFTIAMGERLGYPNPKPERKKGQEYNEALQKAGKALLDELKTLQKEKDNKREHKGPTTNN